MKNQTKAKMLRVYVGEFDQMNGGPLYAALVARFMEIGVAGATVLRPSSGTRLLVEAVDIPDRIDIALAALDDMGIDGLATVQDVTAIRYFKDPKCGREGGK
ncbi:MAG: DUF190 domain-containing protein [Capsulimonadaceae bacterium]|nr:DUF190 domain-containing protein [Capsulimonadaceae bacterium]